MRVGIVHVGHMQEPTHSPHGKPDGPEPMFNIPFVPLVVAVGLIILYGVQSRTPDQGLQLGFRSDDLQQGYWQGLFTYTLVHGGWMHVIMNSLGIVAFGSPVARDLNRGLGTIAWLVFFVLCGVIAGVGYCLFNMNETVWVIGSSGAMFGLIGASTRLIAGPGLLIPLFHPVVIRAALVWLGITAALGLAQGMLTSTSAVVAWETHIVGFIAGVLLIGPFHRMFGQKRPDWVVPDNQS